MWCPPLGEAIAPGQGRRSVHRRTPPRAHSEFDEACFCNVEDLSSPTFLKNVLEQPWHGAGFHRLATHPLSQQGHLCSSDSVVVQLQVWSFFTIQLTAVLVVLVHLVNSSSCPEDILAVYKIRLETFWSEERFPKQYPQWRPPAQWSKTVGRSLCFFFNYYRDVDKILSKKFKELFLDYACLFRFYSSARVPAFQGKTTLKLCATYTVSPNGAKKAENLW